MARIRTTKPEFWTSEQIVSCDPLARLLFIGLWNFCDDAGVHPASCKRLKMEVFPSDAFSEDMIRNWIGELIDNGLLREYVGEDQQRYWQVTGWKKHQRIDKPTYKFPLPLEAIKDDSRMSLQELDDSSSNSQRVLDDGSSNVPRVLDESSTMEGKGREWIGKEEDICEVETSHSSISEDTLGTNRFKSHSDEEQEIFQYWKEIMQHHKANLDKSRRTVIRQALDLGYTVNDLKLAIEGCSYSSFNMGDNDRGQRYDGIALIFSNADQIDRFIAIAANPPVIKKSPNDVATDLMIGAI